MDLASFLSLELFSLLCLFVYLFFIFYFLFYRMEVEVGWSWFDWIAANIE